MYSQAPGEWFWAGMLHSGLREGREAFKGKGGRVALSVSQTVDSINTEMVTPGLTPELGPQNCPSPTAPVGSMHWPCFPGSVLLCLLHPWPETPGSLIFVCR